jgi:hypothetical protein
MSAAAERRAADYFALAVKTNFLLQNRAILRRVEIGKSRCGRMLRGDMARD